MQVGDQEVSTQHSTTQQKALQATALRRGVCDCAELIKAAAKTKIPLGTNKNHWSARPAGCEHHILCWPLLLSVACTSHLLLAPLLLMLLSAGSCSIKP